MHAVQANEIAGRDLLVNRKKEKINSYFSGTLMNHYSNKSNIMDFHTAAGDYFKVYNQGKQVSILKHSAL